MFELITPTEATLRTMTPRTEKHGDDEVSAVSLGLTIVGPNTLLDSLQPGVRTMLYAPHPDQDELPGVEPSTTLLRAKGVECLHLSACFEGWTMTIDAGIDVDEPIVLGGCKVDKWVVFPREGGSIDMTFRVGTSDIDEREAGWLFGKLKQSLSITLHAPKQQEPAIDGTVAAFEADHLGEAEKDAGELFADTHG